MLNRIGVLFLFLSMLSGCGASEWPEQHGKVIDEATGKGIADVIVVARWKGVGAFTTSICFHVESTTTSEDGDFKIPSYQNDTKYTNLDGERVDFSFYKIGYEESQKTYIKKTWKGGDYYMKPFVGTEEERFEYLVRLNASCTEAGASRKNLYPFYLAQYQEQNALARTAKQREFVVSQRWLVGRMAVSTEEEDISSDEMDKRVDQYLAENPL